MMTFFAAIMNCPDLTHIEKCLIASFTNNVFKLLVPETAVDGGIVVTVESTPADTVIAVRYKSENGYVLVRTYQLTENERKETSTTPEALTRIIKKKRLLTTEDIKKAVLGAAGISSD